MNSIKHRITDFSREIVPDGYRNYGKYGVFPEDWRITTLGEITSRLNERNGDSSEYPAYSINNQVGFIPQKEQFEEGSYDGLDKSSYRIVERGQFAYNPARINVGSIGVLKDCDKAIISSLYVCFDTSKDVCKSYLENWFRTTDFYKEIIRNTEGSVREYLFYENFSNIRIALPPLEEQKRIAEILECCDKVIRLKRELIEEKKKQKKSLMQKLMRLQTAHYRNDSLGQNITLISGVDFTPSYYNETNDGTPYLTGASNIEGKNIIINRWTRFPRNIAVQNDIILVCKGAGVGTIAKMNYPKAHIARQLMAIRGGDKMKTDYIYYFLEDSIYEIKKKSKGLIEGIDRKTILELRINVPPVSYQEKTIRILSSADHELDLLEQDLTQWERKKKSLMQLLLTGKVRV